MHVFATLTPVFLIIALGTLLRRTGFLTPEFVGGLNRLTYWVALPALLFNEIVQSRGQARFFGDPFLVMVAVMVVTILLAYALAGLCGETPDGRGTFAQAAFRGNLAYIGLPVVIFATQGGDPRAVATAAYLLASVVPFYNIAAVIVLLARRQGWGWAMLRSLVLLNPLILSCVAAAAWARWAPPLPVWSGRTLEALGNMALPLALLGIGATLHLEKIRGRLRAIAAASLLKIALGPLLGWALGRLLGLDGPEMLAVLIYLATPTATVSFVMADQLGGDRALAAGAVAASTVLSFVPLWFILVRF